MSNQEKPNRQPSERFLEAYSGESHDEHETTLESLHGLAGKIAGNEIREPHEIQAAVLEAKRGLPNLVRRLEVCDPGNEECGPLSETIAVLERFITSNTVRY